MTASNTACIDPKRRRDSIPAAFAWAQTQADSGIAPESACLYSRFPFDHSAGGKCRLHIDDPLIAGTAQALIQRALIDLVVRENQLVDFLDEARRVFPRGTKQQQIILVGRPERELPPRFLG